MIDCEYLKNIILYGLYFIFITIELICTSFLIYNTESIKNILNNEIFQIHCKSDRINTFNDGVLYENTFAFLIMLLVMILMILINIFNYKKNLKNTYELKTYEEESKLLLNIIKIDRIKLTFNIILIMSIIGFFVLNITQLIFQLYNVSIKCIKLIDNNINGFLVVYSLLGCCCTLISISLIFICSFFLNILI